MSAVAHFSLRLLRRDARAGELHLLVAALVIAVAVLSAVGFVTDRVRQALERGANQLLGADLLLIADHPWRESVRGEIRQIGLEMAETRAFPSMVTYGEGQALRAQLVEIKAVSPGYPLRGHLWAAPELNAPEALTPGIPEPATVWVDERLASALSLSVGDTLSVGERRLRVAAILTQEPDRGVNFFSVAPRLMMNLADLDSTGLIQSGSRVVYRLLVSGDDQRMHQLRDRVGKKLEPGERIEDAQNARPEIRTALARANKFLGLSALLAVVLAAVSVALATRRYVQRRLDPCAVMRCLGATQVFLLKVYVQQFLVIGVLAALAGCLLGYLAHFVLHAGLAPLLAMPLPPPGWLPAAQGVLIGLALLFGFAVPPLLQLKNVPTLRVLRREFASGALPLSRMAAYYFPGLLVLLGLMFWIAGEIQLGATIAAGFVGALLVFALLARLAIRLAALMRHGLGRSPSSARLGWRYGLASLERRPLACVVQVVALSIGFMALLLLTVVRNDLMLAWQQAIPAEAPNRFVVNIQPEQLARVRDFFSSSSVAAEFSPMVRGRLTRINDQVTSAESYPDERAKRLIEREFNLSYRADLPEGNRVSAGRWFVAGEETKGLASVEEGLAKTLGLKLGDQLEFNVAGEPVNVKVIGLRRLNWDSMRVNFFVLTPPGVLRDYPASWITSFYLPPEMAGFANRLVRTYPNLTVIDVAAIVRQLQGIMNQVAQSVQFIFLFTLAGGVVVLYATLISAADERRFELAVMRALGARREQLRGALLAEFAAIGGLSGLIAAIGAMAVGQWLAHKVFQFDVAIDRGLPLLAALGGALLVAAAGWFAAARLIDTPPLEALRCG